MKKLYFIIGFLLHPYLKFAKVKNIWIFGAEHGQAYIDNSKYFFEYVRHEHKEINAFWLTQSKSVYDDLQSKGVPVINNFSLKGIYLSAVAKFIIFSTSQNDLLFIIPKKNRKIINLWHGMPMKKIVYDYEPHKYESASLKNKLWIKFVAGFQLNQVNFNFSTSIFFSKILESAFDNKNIFITGQPRTDAFFQWDAKEIRRKLGFTLEDKIVTYMPTHRAYGKGEINPFIFHQNNGAIEYFEKNNYKIVWKFHKNMLHAHQNNKNISNVFLDLSLNNIDPQELLFISDVLITDYSSCYIDYLLLKRPVIFYHYDNYSLEDNELYFESISHNVGPVVNNEMDLLEKIRNRKDFVNSVEYHKYLDGNSCNRVFSEITK